MKKVSELNGAELDYWVAKAEDMDADIVVDGGFSPSRRWHDGGPIIERGRISVYASTDEGKLLHWVAVVETIQTSRRGWIGTTPLIAAMRAFVASKYGQEVGE